MAPGHRLIEDRLGLAEVVAALAEQPTYAVDTEFHRERTYFPCAGLIQLAWPGECALVDPLAVDLGPLAPVLEGPGLAVMHAAQQDLEVLARVCGSVPSSLFDTQLAAGFLGYSTPSLRLLSERVLGVQLPKTSRLTDWLRRPLGADQLAYAASDAVHLLELAGALRSDLVAAGRLAWASQECEALRLGGWGPPEPEGAWLRIRGARHLEGRGRGVAQELAAWRERRAAALDRPARRVLPDLAVIGIASDRPGSPEALRRVRGVEGQHLRGDASGEILAAVERGRGLPVKELRLPRRGDVDAEQRPAVALATAWVGQLARQLRIDATLLATRSDLAAYLGGSADARLAQGWRHELVGRPLRRLAAGELALAVEGDGGLVLERRSREAVLVEPAVGTWDERARRDAL